MWSRFLARAGGRTDERTNEGVLRGPRGPKNFRELFPYHYHIIIIKSLYQTETLYHISEHSCCWATATQRFEFGQLWLSWLPNSTDSFCQQTNTKDIAGQSALWLWPMVTDHDWNFKTALAMFDYFSKRVTNFPIHTTTFNWVINFWEINFTHFLHIFPQTEESQAWTSPWYLKYKREKPYFELAQNQMAFWTGNGRHNMHSVHTFTAI